MRSALISVLDVPMQVIVGVRELIRLATHVSDEYFRWLPPEEGIETSSTAEFPTARLRSSGGGTRDPS